MRDRVGELLALWRRRRVLPHVRGRLLDVGCGLNRLSRSYAGDACGVDVHDWGDVDFIVDDAASLPFDDASFDTVSCVAALNHIPNRTEALREIHRVLRPGGRLVVTMIPPGVSRVWHTLRSRWDADQTERSMGEGEVYGITSHEMVRLLEGAGFEIALEVRFMLGVNQLTVAIKAD